MVEFFYMIKALKKKIVYENKWIRMNEDIVQFPDGSEGIYAYMEQMNPGSLVIPLTDDNKLVVLKEWRYPIQNWTYCFPFGGREEGENYLENAKRELKEETGFEAKEWIDLGVLQIDPGQNSQTNSIFLARGLTQRELKKEVSEIHEVKIFSLEKVEDMIEKGEITNGWLLAGFTKLKVYLGRKI